MILDFERFQDELNALGELFDQSCVDTALPRLKEIYQYTETKWRAYADKIQKGVVRYVLIAEAPPPWREDGLPRFWLDPQSAVRLGALRRVFCQSHVASYCDVLKVAAERGFLLLESIPFAMKYTSSMRLRQEYSNLLKLTVKTYLQAKIDASGLTWSHDLRIAFSLQRNACAIIRASDGQLSFGGNPYAISKKHIAVNGAGYPDWKKLRCLYGIECDDDDPG